MTIEIHDASLEARIQKQLQATGSSSVEEVPLRLLDTQEEHDRWLLGNRDENNAKIRRGRVPHFSPSLREVGFHGPIPLGLRACTRGKTALGWVVI
jgi:hypothetical protein